MTVAEWGMDGWWSPLALLACAVPVAWWIDRWLGEPPVPLHPVVWMGQYLGWAGRWVAPAWEGARERAATPSWGSRWGRFVAGASAWWLGAALILIAFSALQATLLSWAPWWAVPLLGVVLKPLLAWRMLFREVQAVEEALGRSLEEGRQQLARLVSRDVTQLSAEQVRESALESLSENLSDSLVAPLFWYALLGLPGAALYRYANTADAMWGYPGERGGRDWAWAGKWAARADDVLSWLPARFTAGLMLLWGPRARRAVACKRLPAQARLTPSPNGGWPMGALALLLGIRLSKPGVYALNPGGEVPTAQHTHEAIRLTKKVAGASVTWTFFAMLLIAIGLQGVPL